MTGRERKNLSNKSDGLSSACHECKLFFWLCVNLSSAGVCVCDVWCVYAFKQPLNLLHFMKITCSLMAILL